MINVLWVAIVAAPITGFLIYSPPHEAADELALNSSQNGDSSATSVSKVLTTSVQEASPSLEPEVPENLVLLDVIEYASEDPSTAGLEFSPSPEPEHATKPVQQAQLRCGRKPQPPRRKQTQAKLWAHPPWHFATTYGSSRMISMDDLMRYSKPVQVQVKNNVNSRNETSSNH